MMVSLVALGFAVATLVALHHLFNRIEASDSTSSQQRASFRYSPEFDSGLYPSEVSITGSVFEPLHK